MKTGNDKRYKELLTEIIGEVSVEISCENPFDAVRKLEKDFYKWFIVIGLDVKKANMFEAYIKLEINVRDEQVA